jgi:hypothetical protein
VCYSENLRIFKNRSVVADCFFGLFVKPEIGCDLLPEFHITFFSEKGTMKKFHSLNHSAIQPS